MVEPIDYENFLQERYNFIVNDSQKDMILFPRNDFKVRTIIYAMNFLSLTLTFRWKEKLNKKKAKILCQNIIMKH